MKKFTCIFAFFLLLIFSISSLQAQNILAEASFSAEGIDRLEVEGQFCPVVVASTNTNLVEFKGQITSKSRGGNFQIKHERQGNTLRVWIERSGKLRWMNIQGSLDFKVPQNLDLDISNSSGSVRVSGLISQHFRVQTSSGSIRGENIQAPATFKSSSGSIKVVNLKGNVEAKSSSGSQKWEKITGDIQTQASSGGIQFEQLNGNIRATTSSGTIRLASVQGTLNLEASSGSLTGKAVKLSGKNYFETSSGSIRMELINNLDDFSFDLKSNSGSIYVGGERAKDRYLSQSEDKPFQITGVSSSGSQRYSKN